MTGEEWLVKKVGAYLPGAYEEVVDVVDAYVLTEKVPTGGWNPAMCGVCPGINCNSGNTGQLTPITGFAVRVLHKFIK